MFLEFSLAFFSLLCYFVFSRKRSKQFPPGPRSWPIVGNLFQVGLEPHVHVMTMRKKYGDIIAIDLGPKRAVFINEHGLIREAFSMLPLCGRPPFPHYTSSEGNRRGLVTSVGKDWIELRRFIFSNILSGFRNGMPIENVILNEADRLTKYIKEHRGQPMSTNALFNIPVLNVVWGIVAGDNYEMTDAKFLKIIYHLKEYMSNAAAQGLLVFAYDWAKMFPKLSGYQHFKDNITPVFKYINNVINIHKETWQEGTQRDLIDSFLQKIKSTNDENSQFFDKTGDEHLLMVIHDLFVGGGDTVATTLKWLVFLMAYHPKIQDKLSSIILKHLEQTKEPLLKSRQMLPFVEAVIMEVMRFSTVAPIGALHEASEDVQFHGYLIPKGTMIVANLWAAMHNADVWGDPENFRPERFLNEDETEVIRHPAFIPFSIGRRICPGEFLAKDELFIFTMTLLQSFKVEFDPSEPIPEMKHVFGAVTLPVHHKVLFSERIK